MYGISHDEVKLIGRVNSIENAPSAPCDICFGQDSYRYSGIRVNLFAYGEATKMLEHI